MKKRAFTILEILVAVLILGILGTLGIPYFQNVIEDSKAKVCEINLETLQKRVEIYSREHGTVPGSLSELRQEDLDKAYAQVMRGKDAWKKWIAYFIVEGPQWGLAYAQGYGFPRLRCPSNPNTSPTAISYGLNSCLANMTSLQYEALGDDIVTVADSDATLFSYAATSVPGCTLSGPDTYDDVVSKRAHKKYNVLGSPELYLKGGMKKEKTAKIKKTTVEEEERGHH